jgi:hypothetical protein
MDIKSSYLPPEGGFDEQAESGFFDKLEVDLPQVGQPPINAHATLHFVDVDLHRDVMSVLLNVVERNSGAIDRVRIRNLLCNFIAPFMCLSKEMLMEEYALRGTRADEPFDNGVEVETPYGKGIVVDRKVCLASCFLLVRLPNCIFDSFLLFTTSSTLSHSM